MADSDGNGSIDRDEMFAVLKKSYEKKASTRSIWKMVDQLFHIADTNWKGEITQKQLLYAAESNEYFRNIVEKIVKDYWRHQSYGVSDKPFELFEYF